MIKKWLCLPVLLLISNALFAISPPTESLVIRNSSSSNIIVNVKFWYGPGSNFNSDYAWHQTVSGLPIVIMDWLTLFNTNTIPPNHEMRIIEYDAGFHEFDEMVAIPIMDKLNAIFKELEIIHGSGNDVMTLDNIKDIEFEKRIPWRGRVIYTLEIFDLVLMETEVSTN